MRMVFKIAPNIVIKIMKENLPSTGRIYLLRKYPRKRTREFLPEKSYDIKPVLSKLPDPDIG